MPSQWKRDTSTLINDTLFHLVEGITGVAASDKKELVFSVGHIFQSLRKGRFLSQLLDEWNLYREKGRIKEDYSESEQHLECLSELFDFLDTDIPDQTRFSMLKKIFLTAATERVSDRDSLLPHQYMKICKTLSSGETILMCAVYERWKVMKPDENTSNSARDWLSTIARLWAYSLGIKEEETVTIKIVIGITITIVLAILVKVFIDKSRNDSSRTTNLQIGSKAGGDIVGRDKKTNK